MVFGTHFTYRGMDSRDFDLVIGSFDGPNNLQETGITLSSESEIMPNGFSLNYGAKYTDTLQFEMTVLHKTGVFFSLNEQREIIRWLTLTTNLDYLEVFNGKYEDILYLCRVIKLQKYWANGQVVGFKFTWQCDSVYQYSHIRQKTIDTSLSNTIRIYNDSDLQYLYPNITIHVQSTEPISITNISENNRVSTLGDYQTNDVIHMNNHNKIMRLGSEYQPVITRFNLNWFRLIPGLNDLEVSGDCKMNFEYREIRKVGEP